MKTLRGLYVITDEAWIPRDRFAETVEQALRGGARIVQYRDKSTDKTKRLQQAIALKQLSEKYQTILIINDDIELALAVDADGVHIGKQDSPLATVRKQMGAAKIIGMSCYNQFASAVDAETLGASYIAFGSFFPSATKPEAVPANLALLTRAGQELNVPICAIGGITLENAPALIQAGTDMVAVITDVWGTKNIRERCEQFCALF